MKSGKTLQNKGTISKDKLNKKIPKKASLANSQDSDNNDKNLRQNLDADHMKLMQGDQSQNSGHSSENQISVEKLNFPDDESVLNDQSMVYKKISKQKYYEFVKTQELESIAKEMMIDLQSDPQISINFLN